MSDGFDLHNEDDFRCTDMGCMFPARPETWCTRTASRDLLDARPSVAEMAGSFEGGPDSVEWLREQRADEEADR